MISDYILLLGPVFPAFDVGDMLQTKLTNTLSTVYPVFQMYPVLCLNYSKSKDLTELSLCTRVYPSEVSSD